MAENGFFYPLAYLLAAPISSMIIGISLDQAYFSRHVALKFRWGTNVVTFLAFIYIVIVVQESSSGMSSEAKPPNTFENATVAQMLTPASVGCVELLVQVYFIQRLLKRFGKTTFTILSVIICGLSFLASWGCTISLLIKMNDPNQEKINPFESKLPTFPIESQILTAWLASSSLAGLIIVGGNLYSTYSARFSRQNIGIRFLKDDHILTKIGVCILQTLALSALLILTAFTIFLINASTAEEPSAGTVGCLVFLNLMRIPVGYGTLVFSLVRERNLSIDEIRQSLISTPNETSEDFHLHEGKNAITRKQVTVHTVRSQVFES